MDASGEVGFARIVRSVRSVRRVRAASHAEQRSALLPGNRVHVERPVLHSVDAVTVGILKQKVWGIDDGRWKVIVKRRRVGSQRTSKRDHDETSQPSIVYQFLPNPNKFSKRRADVILGMTSWRKVVPKGWSVPALPVPHGRINGFEPGKRPVAPARRLFCRCFSLIQEPQA